MNLLSQMEVWSAGRHPRWLVVPRVALGLCLFAKGILFINNTATLQQWLASSHITQPFPWLAYAITWVHLFGGFLIIAGLLTRFAIAIQIPIILGAVFLVNSARIFDTSLTELMFSVVVLLALIFFFIEGAGPVSLDNYFSKNPV